ncbi:MAG: ATP-dependent Clp protease ATP-binding subunit ClpX [Bacteroidetes bacterium SW_4_67_19]|jgi:ATP-dependent Clp protease ATP-binding subunit ClpX|nr:MAG: ATP-dependent Clp protease ATP-binding subunit ClpX [Bacteroidetes bacterium SW_4_67_19]
MNTARPDTPRCSFCERPAGEVDSLVAGPEVYICDRCISDAAGIVSGEREQSQRAAEEHRLAHALPPPHRLKALLDEHVVGQEEAKRLLSVAVYNHYKRVRHAETGDEAAPPRDPERPELAEVELEKANVLFVGPTGTGKTLLARTLAGILEVPFCIADATTLTEAGYVGEDVESILSQLLHAADFDTDRAERGIVYLDEIDKLAHRRAGASVTRDVSGQGVQQALLKLLEGTIAGVPPEGGRKHPEQPLVQIDTTGILFICGGAFDGLDDLIEQRLSRRAGVGFRAEDDSPLPENGDAPRSALRQTTPEDLLAYGFIPELVGRLPVIGTLEALSTDALRRILTEPKNALVKQYRKLFALDDFELVFDEAALEAVVERAETLGTGARGLRAVLEEVMLDIMFSMHQRTAPARCRITRGVVEHGDAPVYEPLPEENANETETLPETEHPPWARRA